MRRLVLITLCLLLPLKALAAVVVPVTGLPGLVNLAEPAAEPASAHCLQMAQMAAADTAHDAADHTAPDPDHPCPHLAMATLAQSAVIFLPSDAAVATPGFTPRDWVSVVLAVPLPPPLA